MLTRPQATSLIDPQRTTQPGSQPSSSSPKRQPFYDIPIETVRPPRGRLRSRWKPPTDKHSRYRLKQQEAGRCPHCGKPCAPYYECATRRFQKRLRYHMNRRVRLSIFYRTADGAYGLTDWTK